MMFRRTLQTTRCVSNMCRFGQTKSFSLFPKPTSSRDVASSLLKIVSSENDIKEYISVYGAPGVTRTTVIKIGGEVIENEMDTLVNSLSFLKEAGLFPILVHGAGPQMNAELERAGVEPQYVGGNRVTDAATLAIAARIFRSANAKLVNALTDAGVPARPITSGVFQATFKDQNVYGYVGNVSKINPEFVEAAIASNQIPVLSCLGESEGGQVLNINADVAARELATTMQPYKTIFINAKGGWIDDDGVKLEEINMARDYERMAARDYTGRQGTLLKLNEINTLLQSLPSTSSVSLTSASALSREILSSCSLGTVCIKGSKGKSTKAKKSDQRKRKKRVGLIGARGYVGRELIQLIADHPDLELVCASSRALAGQKVMNVAIAPPVNPHTLSPVEGTTLTQGGRNIKSWNIAEDLEFVDLGLNAIPKSKYADEVDVWVLALPNGYCEDYSNVLDSLDRKDKIIIDLSSDQRFNPDWVYGLPEAPKGRENLNGATHISNPGCYATGAQVGLLPLLGGKGGHKILDTSIPPHVFGVSGYSGAGTGLSNANNPKMLKDNIIAYKSVNHIHEHEVSRHLNTPVRFMPHVAPFFRGIHLTVAAQLSSKHANLNEQDIYELYAEFFKDEKLIQVQKDMPWVKDIANQHNVAVGGFTIDKDTGRLVIISTIDNLLKGAATQAIQNINIALGLNEYAGISSSS